MTNFKVRNKLNYNHEENIGEINDQPSLTVPDQTMSLRTIVERYTRGLPIDGAKVPIYDEENDLPDFRTLDLAERQEYAEQYAEELKHLAKKAKKAEEKVAKEKLANLENIPAEQNKPE